MIIPRGPAMKIMMMICRCLSTMTEKPQNCLTRILMTTPRITLGILQKNKSGGGLCARNLRRNLSNQDSQCQGRSGRRGRGTMKAYRLTSKRRAGRRGRGLMKAYRLTYKRRAGRHGMGLMKAYRLTSIRRSGRRGMGLMKAYRLTS